jgi:hypothetical protein
MMRRWLSVAPLCAAAAVSAAQTWPFTRPEITNYLQTSTYADVVDFLHSLQRMGAPISIQSMGKSTEGKDMPLVIASYPPVASPAEARRLGRPIVFIQGNIHAGEVEGKEAALMVLRKLSQDGPKGLLSKMVLLVAPIYNIDGNEKFGPQARNRPGQDGPELVGVRANGQGLDLNRDAIKAEAPETRGLLQHVYNTWDPDVMMDLHTTNGTRHGWELTYSPPLNPNTEPMIMRLSRDMLIPSVRRTVEKNWKLPLFDYGNAETRKGKQAWYTFGQEGRYCTNYVGLRNRIGILSEATSFIPFRARVEVTDKFVTTTLDWVAANAGKVMDATRGADAKVVSWGLDPAKAPAQGVRFDFDTRGMDTVLLEPRPADGSHPSGRPKTVNKIRMPVWDRFKATKISKFPAAYIIPASETKTVDLLLQHGIVVEQLLEDWRGPVDEFTIAEFKQAERPFQNHRLIELNGTFSPGTHSSVKGDYVVRTAQPLGILIFHMLEPESLDGVAAWGFMGESFPTATAFSIRKTFVAINSPMMRKTQ